MNGLHWCLYEPLYFAGGSSYAALYAMFYAFNPSAIQVLATTIGAVGAAVTA